MHRLQSLIEGRIGRAAGVLVVLGFVVAGAGGVTFRAAPQGTTKGFLIVRSDLGVHYGNFEGLITESGEELLTEDGEEMLVAVGAPLGRRRDCC